MDSKKLALCVAAGAKDKKAKKVHILDMRASCDFCDYFVIASGTSLRHASAIAQGIVENLDKQGRKPLSKVHYNDESGWLVLDYAGVVAHVFYEPLRDFYALERLWSDAKRVRITSKF